MKITTKDHFKDLGYIIHYAFKDFKEDRSISNFLASSIAGVSEAVSHDIRVTKARHPLLNKPLSSSVYEEFLGEGYMIHTRGYPCYTKGGKLLRLPSPRPDQEGFYPRIFP